MPVTNDWNIAYPSPLDPGNFAAQMAALAQSTDNALTVVNDTATDGNTLYFLNQTERDAYPTANLKVGQECHIQGSNERYRWDGSNWLHTNVFYSWTWGTGSGQWNPGHTSTFDYNSNWTRIARSGNWVNLNMYARRSGNSWGTNKSFSWGLPSWAAPLFDQWVTGMVNANNRPCRVRINPAGTIDWQSQATPIPSGAHVLFSATYLAKNAVKV